MKENNIGVSFWPDRVYARIHDFFYDLDEVENSEGRVAAPQMSSNVFLNGVNLCNCKFMLIVCRCCKRRVANVIKYQVYRNSPFLPFYCLVKHVSIKQNSNCNFSCRNVMALQNALGKQWRVQFCSLVSVELMTLRIKKIKDYVSDQLLLCFIYLKCL